MVKLIDEPAVSEGLHEINQALLKLEEESGWPVGPMSPAQLEETKTRVKLALLVCKGVSQVWDSPGTDVVRCVVGRVNFMSPGRVVDIQILPGVAKDDENQQPK